jgi:putative cell wall-binding protein
MHVMVRRGEIVDAAGTITANRLRRYPMRRVTLLPLLLLVVALAPTRVHAQESTEEPATEPEVHDIVFPVIGDVSYSDTFGAPRGGGRSHEGQDLLGTKMQQLVAADRGTVTFLTWPEASYGYYIELTADDGFVYSYVHLNNDTPGTDDDSAEREDVYGPGIDVGARVERGQLLGYMGDSGNAEHTAPHLHFEMQRPSGTVMNPYESLEAAQRLDSPAGLTVEPSPIPRLAGDDRVATSVAVSERGWPDGAPSAVLASGEAYAEALPASVLAATASAPLLLVTGDGLPAAVDAELNRLEATAVTVIGSVPAAVDDQLRATGRGVTRLGAPGDAVGTAASIARQLGGGGGVAVLVNRSRFADGVSAAGLAAVLGWPILLTDADLVPQATVDVWREIGVAQVVLVGGSAVIRENIEAFVRERGRCAGQAGCAVERLAGADRYATSVAAVERALGLGGASVATVLLGTGTNYPDTLAAGPLAGRLDGISLLVDGSGHGDDIASRSFLSDRAEQVGDVAILGGPGAVTSAADRAIQEALGLR